MLVQCAQCGREAHHRHKVDLPLSGRQCECGATGRWDRISPPPTPRAKNQKRPRHDSPSERRADELGHVTIELAPGEAPPRRIHVELPASVADADFHATRVNNERDVAERNAVAALARYKFAMFGYWAGLWVHLNRLCRVRRRNPFKAFVEAARIAKAALTAPAEGAPR